MGLVVEPKHRRQNLEILLEFVPPLSTLILYVTFSILVFAVQQSIKEFKGASKLAHWCLLLTGFGGLLFKYGYIVYYGFVFSWQHAAIFWVVGGLFLAFPGTTILAVFTHKNRAKLFLFGYSGIVTLPLLGYFMVTSFPN